MIITTKQFLSPVWLVVALLVATLLIAVLPNTVQAQALSSNEVSETGHARWHNLSKHGAKTVSGERYDHKAMSAAHATLPFDTMVRVQNMANGTSVTVRINDRIKSGSNQIIDLSGAAAEKLGLFESGAAEVRVTILDYIDILANNESDPNQSVEAIGPPAPVSQPTVDVTSAPEIETSLQKVSRQIASSNPNVFTLQIGSFATQEHATRLANQFEQAWVSSVESEGEVSFRVYYSQFEDEEPARTVQSKLWSEGQDSFLRKVIS